MSNSLDNPEMMEAEMVRRNRELMRTRDELTTAKSHIVQWQNKNQEQLAKMSEFEGEMNRAISQRDQANAELEKIKAENADAEAEKERVKKEKKESAEKLDKINEELESLKQKVEGHEKEKKKIEAHLNAKNTEVQELQQARQDFQTMQLDLETKIDDIKNQLNMKTRKLEKSEARNEEVYDLQKQLTELKAEKTQLTKTHKDNLEAAEKSVKDVQNELTQLQKHKDEVQGEAELKTLKLQDLESQLETAKAEHAANVAKLEESVASASEDKMKAVEAVERAKVQIEEERKALETKHKQETDSKQKEFSERMTKLGDQLEANEKKRITVVQQLDDAKKSLEEDKNRLQKEVKKLNADLDAAKQGHKEMTQKTEASKKSLEDEKMRLESEVKTLQQAQNDLAAKVTTKETEHDKVVKQLNTELEAAKQGHKETTRKSEADKQSLEGEKARLESEVKTLQQAQSDLAAKVTTKETEHDKVVKQLNTELDAAKQGHKETTRKSEADKQSLEGEKARLESEVKALLQTQGDLTAKLTVKETEHDKAVKQLEEASKEHAEMATKMSTDLDEQKKSHDVLLSEKARLTADLDMLSSKLEKLETEHANLQKQKTSLEQQTQSSKSDVATHISKIESLEKEIKSTQAAYEDSKGDLSKVMAEKENLRDEHAKALDDLQSKLSSDAGSKLVELEKTKKLEIEKMQQQLEDVQTKLKAAEKEAVKEADGASAARVESEQKLAELQQANEKHVVEKEDLKKQHAEHVENIQAEKNEVEKDLAEQKRLLDVTTKSLNEQHEEKLRVTQTSLDDLRGTLKTKESELEVVKDAHQQALKSVESSKEETERSKEDVQVIRETFEKEVAGLQKQVTAVQEEKQHLSDQLRAQTIQKNDESSLAANLKKTLEQQSDNMRLLQEEKQTYKDEIEQAHKDEIARLNEDFRIQRMKLTEEFQAQVQKTENVDRSRIESQTTIDDLRSALEKREEELTERANKIVQLEQTSEQYKSSYAELEKEKEDWLREREELQQQIAISSQENTQSSQPDDSDTHLKIEISKYEMMVKHAQDVEKRNGDLKSKIKNERVQHQKQITQLRYESDIRDLRQEGETEEFIETFIKIAEEKRLQNNTGGTDSFGNSVGSPKGGGDRPSLGESPTLKEKLGTWGFSGAGRGPNSAVKNQISEQTAYSALSSADSNTNVQQTTVLKPTGSPGTRPTVLPSASSPGQDSNTSNSEAAAPTLNLGVTNFNLGKNEMYQVGAPPILQQTTNLIPQNQDGQQALPDTTNVSNSPQQQQQQQRKQSIPSDSESSSVAAEAGFVMLNHNDSLVGSMGMGNSNNPTASTNAKKSPVGGFNPPARKSPEHTPVS